mmetsp:Transcript_117016/g.338255  ORF Transcript_117016/g.338255 Transcript_117016/m.338255 type:complete len:222 (+) Transcript_117016:2380-3045(+)
MPRLAISKKLASIMTLNNCSLLVFGMTIGSGVPAIMCPKVQYILCKYCSHMCEAAKASSQLEPCCSISIRPKRYQPHEMMWARTRMKRHICATATAKRSRSVPKFNISSPTLSWTAPSRNTRRMRSTLKARAKRYHERSLMVTLLNARISKSHNVTSKRNRVDRYRRVTFLRSLTTVPFQVTLPVLNCTAMSRDQYTRMIKAANCGESMSHPICNGMETMS